MSTALIAGEVLFDIFEDGSQVLGGAPFNVAWHLHGLGVTPLFVSSVGSDAHGNEIREAMQTWGMSTEALQKDSNHSTGTVQIKMKAGSHAFDIVRDVAYDFIEKPQNLDGRIENCKLMYHGSLAMRSTTSRQTIMQLRKDSGLPAFVDVNLRAPFWDKSFIEEIIYGAGWVKLNDEELLLLGEDGNGDLIASAQQFRKKHNIHSVIITRGKEGAFIAREDSIEEVKAAPIENLIDTVGAGDGFSAMTIAGVIQGWDYKEILEAASLFASKICGLRGAISKDRAFYDDFLDEIH